MRVTDIIPYENNPRFNDQAVAAVIESIRECSYIQPIIVDEKKVILAGHTRHKALIELNVAECDVIVIKGLTEEQKKKYRFLDNKTGESAEWDILKLSEELEKWEMDEAEFFDMAAEAFEMGPAPEYVGSTEYDVGVFDDEEFKYTCENCGFKFNA